jgi:protein-L-isoaspartate(D-aspartate) O-methyltransferase
VDPVRLRQRMVRNLEVQGISNPLVLAAMGAVPRHLFVQEALRSQAYEDTHLPIGHGQTISQPYTVAIMCELLEVLPGMRVLEVGAGSGYQAAVLATMGCTVFAVERLRELYQSANALLRQLNFHDIHMLRGDGTLGLPDAAPFERIVVSAGGPVIPHPLTEQLDEGGVLLIPVGAQQRTQRLARLRKNHGLIAREDLEPAKFVDLIGDHGWQPQP